eukprot:CAMPEP_0206204638 /NCGR_PEP_ID=MMETSP0166-20121206/13667_1 /ASSEMBLY_ACC=CAM_ASM_000260 /TAXON_ID=95228 /ORGANISM="Vannella robusta, Strain DIVA3 518/3/11/1/6" /LENGTH=78 /DNA_ID=CAMNT_0053624351 /DNA_START=268 /DNA_END=504 /DNA_ORIENTATION=-
MIRGVSWKEDGQNQSYFKKYYSLLVNYHGNDLVLNMRTDIWTGYTPLDPDDEYYEEPVEGEECFICKKLHASLSHQDS